MKTSVQKAILNTNDTLLAFSILTLALITLLLNIFLVFSM